MVRRERLLRPNGEAVREDAASAWIDDAYAFSPVDRPERVDELLADFVAAGQPQELGAWQCADRCPHRTSAGEGAAPAGAQRK